MDRHRPSWLWLVAALVLMVASPGGSAIAQDDAYAEAVAALSVGGFRDKEAAIGALVGFGDPRAMPVLEAMLDNRLHLREADGLVVIVAEAGGSLVTLTDAVTLEDLGTVDAGETSRIRVNNRVRRALRAAIGQLSIAAPDPAARLAAARELGRDRSPETAALLTTALETEADAAVRDAMEFSLAQIELGSDDREVRLVAIARLAETASPRVRSLLNPLVRQNSDGTYAEEDAEVR